MNFIYLDYAAATPVDERVLAAMQPYYNQHFYNPSATYLPARQVAADLQAARTGVAGWLGCRPAEVIFTAGGTEANNLAIHGIMRQFPEANIVVSGIEHDAVLGPARAYDCREVPVTPDGFVDLAALEATVDERTVLVSIMYANNEIGTIQPLRDIARIIAKAREQRAESRERGSRTQSPALATLPLLFHTDACQAANYLDLHAARLGVDLMTVNGGKLYGPKQSGALYVGSHVNLLPEIAGGGQERNLRSGTENVAQDVGLALALQLAQEQRQAEATRLQALQRAFIDGVRAAVPQAGINGSLKKRLPNNVHITIPGADNERLLIELEGKGILAAAGSACSASDDEPSHVLRAIGLSDRDARSSLRFTMGRQTSEQDITAAVAALRSLC